jgi:hypothetical protein
MGASEKNDYETQISNRLTELMLFHKLFQTELGAGVEFLNRQTSSLMFEENNYVSVISGSGLRCWTSVGLLMLTYI